MVERLQEILNSKLNMVSKMEEIKKLLKEFHREEDLEVIFNLLIKKSIDFKPEYKVQELEILALRELMVEKIENGTKEELDDFNKIITIWSLEYARKMQEIQLMNPSNINEKSNSLTNDDYNYKRVFYDYSINNASESAKEVAANENKKVELKRIKQIQDLINLYRTILHRKMAKDKKTSLKN